MLPPILQDLVGKTLLFKIGIERENYLYKHPTYKVLKIMSNINEFDAIGSPTVCVSMDSVVLKWFIIFIFVMIYISIFYILGKSEHFWRDIFRFV